MNFLFLTLLYPKQTQASVLSLSRDGMQSQINHFQWALLDGMRAQLRPDEKLSVVNATPVGAFPHRYRGCFLRGGKLEEGLTELGCVNIPPLKQWGRRRGAAKAIVDWARQSPQNRTVLVYTLYLPYMQAILQAKKRIPDLTACVIVTDLPNELGITSYRRGLWKRLERHRGRKVNALCGVFDRYLLLTRQMADVLPVGHKPFLVLEGLAAPLSDAADVALPAKAADTRPAVLYAGTINRELGIGELIKAFQESPLLKNIQLWLCGKGDMEADAAKAENEHIHYFGFVKPEVAISLQRKADVLVNPRPPRGEYTKYSFPSKTLEYLRSGKPVLCFRLEGIPKEYDGYLRYFSGDAPQAMAADIAALLALPEQERQRIGQAGQAFALTQKSALAQSRRALDFLRVSSRAAVTQERPL